MPLRQDRHQNRRAVLGEHHRQMHRIEVARQIRLDGFEQRRVAVPLFAQKDRVRVCHPAERSCRQGEQRSKEKQNDDRGN